MNFFSNCCRFFVALAAVSMLAGVYGARAQEPEKKPENPSQIVKTISTRQLHAFMKSIGYEVTIEDAGVILWKIGEFKTLVLLNEDQNSLLFHVSIPAGDATLRKVNAWNRSKRYSRSYLNKSGDPCLELDLALKGGVTRARMADYFKTCRVSFVLWLREVVLPDEE